MSSNPNVRAVAANVRAEIARRGLTQRDVAKKISRNQQYLSRRLSAKVPFDVADLDAVATVFGLTITDLIPDERIA